MYPKLLHIFGPVWIHSYGVMIAVGFLFFSYFLYKNPKRIKLISNENFLNLLFIGLSAGIIGGRLIFVLYELDLFKDNYLQIFYPWIGGFGIMGSVLGILLILPIYLKIKKVKILPLFDLVAIYAGLLEGFGRIGCFFAGCCYGAHAGLHKFCSVTFTNPDGLAPLNIALYPTQLFSSFFSFLVFLIIYFRAKYFSHKNGELIFSFLFLSSLSRFCIDFFRGDRDFISGFDLISYYQIVALVIVILSFVALIYIRKKK